MELVKNRVLMEDLEKTAKTFAETDEFVKLMTLYRCAIMEIETKLRVLDAEFSLQYDRNPFEHIESRLKNPVSIVEKMHRRNIPITVRDMERELYDIAGIRVVCSFIEDIYKLADLLVEQDDVLLVQKKDYIVSPKPNGYRSLHMIVDIPIFLSEGKKHMKVEVQFRTIAMDFWASVEHKLKYKKQLKNQDEVIDRLQKCASILSSLDDEMENLRLQIDMDEENGRE